MEKKPEESKDKIIQVGPDYTQMVQAQSNSAILNCVINWIFKPETTFTVGTVTHMSVIVVALITVKTMLENSSKYIDTMQIVDHTYMKYLWQRCRHHYTSTDIFLLQDKWMYDNKGKTLALSTDALSTYFSRRDIYINVPGSYYFNFRLYVINVVISKQTIKIRYPDIQILQNAVFDDMVYPNRTSETSDGTQLYQLSCTVAPKLEPMRATCAFSTRNYRELEETIKNYFLTGSCLGAPITPLGIFFRGPPGTGKTSFGSYISSSKIFDKIVLCNMVPVTSNSLKEFIGLVERQLTNNAKSETLEHKKILLIMDEIDKWILGRIDAKITAMREEARKKSETKEGEAKILFDKLTPDEENAHRKQLLNDFFDQLYALINGNMTMGSRKYAFILNMNGYDELFGNIDKKYGALLDRFSKFDFNYIGKPEIIEYLENCAQQMRKKANDPELDSLMKGNTLIQSFDRLSPDVYDPIPDGIRISYRELYSIFISKNNSMSDIVDKLCNLQLRAS